MQLAGKAFEFAGLLVNELIGRGLGSRDQRLDILKRGGGIAGGFRCGLADVFERSVGDLERLFDQGFRIRFSRIDINGIDCRLQRGNSG
ncbi:MAG: hypothetical protein ABJE77_10425 [Tateyamaria sp.]